MYLRNHNVTIRHYNVKLSQLNFQYNVTCKIEVVYCICHVISIRSTTGHRVPQFLPPLLGELDPPRLFKQKEGIHIWCSPCRSRAMEVFKNLRKGSEHELKLKTEIEKK